MALVVDGSSPNVIELMAKLIKIKLNNGCRKPLRILINSRENANVSALKQKMIMMFGVIGIDMDNLVMSHINGKTIKGLAIVEVKSLNLPIPDNLLMDIIQERIEKVDCRINGFVLDMKNYDIGILEKSGETPMSFHLCLNLDGGRNPQKTEELKRTMRFEKSFDFAGSDSPDDSLHKVFYEISHFYE